MSRTKELQTYGIDPAAMMAYVPPLGTFVAFSIDPVATVKALKDPYATNLASSIPTSKYVGYVEEASSFFEMCRLQTNIVRFRYTTSFRKVVPTIVAHSPWLVKAYLKSRRRGSSMHLCVCQSPPPNSTHTTENLCTQISICLGRTCTTTLSCKLPCECGQS